MANLCLGCGHCCVRYRVAFHWSETTDGGGPVPVELTEPLRRHEVAMRGTGVMAGAATARCIALAGEPGRDAHCSLHGRHPSVCREVAVGSDQCNRARRAAGLPIATPAEVAAAYADVAPPARPLEASSD